MPVLGVTASEDQEFQTKLNYRNSGSKKTGRAGWELRWWRASLGDIKPQAPFQHHVNMP